MAVIKNLLGNPRSKVVTTSVHFLIDLVENYGQTLHPFVVSIFKTDILFKLLNSSNKIIYSAVSELFMAIMARCPHYELYPILIAELGNKNVRVRECISECLVVLSGEVEFPSKLESAIKRMTTDSSQVVRSNSVVLKELLIKKGEDQRKSKQEARRKENIENVGKREIAKISNKHNEKMQ
jgi:hypothetical protein